MVLWFLTAWLAAGAPDVPDWVRTEEASADVWTTRHGLPQNTVRALAQTPDGYVWIATLGGLARFDGRRFHVMEPDEIEGLRAIRIRDLAWRDGALWLAAEDGGAFAIRDGKAESLLREPAYDLAFEADGTPLVATVQGVFRVSGGVAERLSDDVDSYFHVVAVPGGGVVAVRASGGAECVVEPCPELPSESLARVDPGPEGAVLFLTSEWDLLRVDDGGIHDLGAVHGQAMWRGQHWRIEDSALQAIDGSTRVGLPLIDPGARVLSHLVDREGALWLGLK